MNSFEASNGATVERFSDSLEVKLHPREEWLAPWVVMALREFFRAERDEELGRWRWPENPNHVVYLSDERGTSGSRRVNVVNESTGYARTVVEKMLGVAPGDFDSAAAAYFEAHPERTPWDDAQHGEIWAMRLEAGPEMVTYVDGESASSPRFIDPSDDMSYGPRSGFTSGRRIWPEAS